VQRRKLSRLGLVLTNLVLSLAWISAATAQVQQYDGGLKAGKESEPRWLRKLTISGFMQNTSGTWLDSEAIEYNSSKNSLSSERNMIQLDVTDELTEHDKFFLRSWAVYEPSYPFETNCLDPSGATVHCNSDYYNQYGIREVWLQHRIGPLNFFIGRQIVTWGESLAFRVGDQINPQDLSWNFGFANLEQSRTPLWMIHPILNLRPLGPLTANFLELIYVPGVDFLYTQVDLSDDSVDGEDAVAGRVNINPPSPGGRFSVRPDARFLVDNAGNLLAAAPPFVLFRNGPLGVGEYFATSTNDIPRATWGNSQIGIRLHTLAWNTEMTAFYLWSHDYGSVLKLNPQFFSPQAGVVIQRGDQIYPQYQSFGVTANRPLYLPGLLTGLPLVVRVEAFYKNHEAFNTFNVPGSVFVGFNPLVGSPTALTRSDEVLWLFALDLDQAYTPWLTTTGNLTANLEVMGTSILSYSHRMMTETYFEHIYHNNVAALVSVGTAWWWGAVAPTWTVEWNPNGQTWLFFPTLQLTPPWTNKYFAKLGWIEVLGSNQYGLDGGVFKGKSLLYAQLQYNFSLFSR
jgi:hypothetical protein